MTRRVNEQTCNSDVLMIQCNQFDMNTQEPVSFITQIYRFSFRYFPCNTEVFLERIYKPYNRALILVNIETIYSLTPRAFLQ